MYRNKITRTIIRYCTLVTLMWCYHYEHTYWPPMKMVVLLSDENSILLSRIWKEYGIY